MSYIPHLRREDGYSYGGYLKHYRTKGSRNGYSNDPNYKPVGQRAQGKLIDGRYVYEDAKAKSSNRLNGSNGVIYEKRIKEKIIPEKRIFEKRTPSPSKPIRTQPQPKQNWFQRGVSNVGKAATNAGNWLGDRGRDAGKAVGSAASNAGRSIGKAATNAGNWLGDRGRDAGKAVGKAASDTKKWAGDRAKDVSKAAANVSKAVGKTAKNVKENITGENYQLHKANKRHLDYKTRFATDDLRNPVFSYQSQSRAEKASAANKAGDANAQELMDKSYKTGKEYREWVQKNADKQRAYAGRSAQEKKAMDSTLDGKIANARKSISDSRKNASKWINDRFGEAKTTAKKAGEAVGSAASKAGEAVGKAASDTKKWAGDRAKDVGKAANEASKAIGNAANDAKKTAGDFVNGLFSKKEKKSSKVKPIETKPIETKPIETKPIETKPIETKPIETKPIESKRNRSKSSNKSSNSKNNMSDKPKGVSDEYWEEYTFNGGTRESWDKENKARSKSSKSSSKSSSSQSEYERVKEYNSRKNNYFGTGSVSNKPNFDHYTYDEKTGKTVWVDKNGKKHSK